MKIRNISTRFNLIAFVFIILNQTLISGANFEIDSTKKNYFYNLNLGLNLSVTPQIKENSFDSTLEYFDSKNVNLFLNPITATSWENILPLINLSLQIRNEDWLEFEIKTAFRKDVESWYLDKNSTNIFTTSREIDINFPTISKLTIKKENFIFYIGRFPFTLNNNTNRSVTLSGSPYDDGFVAKYILKNIGFTFYISSLNPWLHNINIRDSSSEYYRQSQLLLLSQQKGRIFSAPYKTLVAHDIKYSNNNFEFRISELSMIGGKYPTLSDLNPFVAWHNDYNDNYANIFVSVQSAYKYSDFKVYGEIAIDDILGGMNETSADSRNIYAFIFGSIFERKNNLSKITIRVEAISVNPYFGNHDIPLLKLISRRMYYSNYRSRNKLLYSDTYFADYPLGYYRGPDVKDVWIDFNYERENISVSNNFGWLRKGSITLGHAHKGDDDKTKTDYDLILPLKPTTELRNNFMIYYNYDKNYIFNLGLMIRKIDKINIYYFVGMSYNVPILSSEN